MPIIWTKRGIIDKPHNTSTSWQPRAAWDRTPVWPEPSASGVVASFRDQGQKVEFVSRSFPSASVDFPLVSLRTLHLPPPPRDREAPDLSVPNLAPCFGALVLPDCGNTSKHGESFCRQLSNYLSPWRDSDTLWCGGPVDGGREQMDALVDPPERPEPH